ncbi:MAG: enoyl-CoA hydratase [Glaciecola sp.]
MILAEMVSPQKTVLAGFLDKVVSEAEFAPAVQAFAQAMTMTKLDMKTHHQTRLKARAELVHVPDKYIEKDRHRRL